MFRLKRVSGLRLGGAQGVFARHVVGMSFEGGRWNIDATELSGEGRVVLFESHSGANRIHLQQVHAVSGKSTEDETEMLVEMELLEVLERSGDVVDVRTTGVRTSEALGLSGGTTRGRGSWAWVPPKMQIGSTIVGLSRRSFVGLIIASLLLFWGFNALALSGDVVTVAAAANLSPILPALEKAFAESDPTPLRFVVGSSGKLTTQIMQGAPFDVFLSADESYPWRLEAKGFCPAAPRVYAMGVLALVFRRDLASAESSAGVDWSRIKRLAVADPTLAPYGRAAIEYLERAEGAKYFSGKRVVGQSIGQTAQFLSSGSVDAGFLALSQVESFSNRKWKWTIIPENECGAIRQAAVLLKRDGRGGYAPAVAFFEFLFSPKAIAIFRKAGYRSPQPTDYAADST